MIPDEIICNMFLFESYETKAPTKPSVYVFQNDRIYNFAELVEVVFEFFISQLEVKTANENL